MATSIYRRARRRHLQQYHAIACTVASVLPKINSDYNLVLTTGYQLFGDKFKRAVIRHIHNHNAKRAITLAIQDCLKNAKEVTRG